MSKIAPKKKFKWTDEGPFEFLRIMASILTALVVTFIVLCFVTKSFAIDIFINLLTYPSRSMFYFGYVLVKMVPLCFAGLAIIQFCIKSISFSKTSFLSIHMSLLSGHSI